MERIIIILKKGEWVGGSGGRGEGRKGKILSRSGMLRLQISASAWKVLRRIDGQNLKGDNTGFQER